MKKISLIYYNENENIEEENVWGKKVNKNIYKIENIPFFAPNLSLGDLVIVEKDNDRLYFDKLLEPSENSTIQLVFFKKNNEKNIIKEIEGLGCQWESMQNKPYYSINVPKKNNYKIIKELLSKYNKQNILDYKEACLSNKHRNEINI